MVVYVNNELISASLFPHTRFYSGSDCSLSDGDASRVLTLNNTKTTNNGALIVSVDTATLDDNRRTIAHKTAGTTVTFTGKIYDAQRIVVIYYTRGA